MLIPKVDAVIMHKGRDLTLHGSIDTGYEGLAIIRPDVARKLDLPLLRTMRLRGFGGTIGVPVVTADALAIKGSANCFVVDPELAVVTEFPGSEEILFGEAFFEQFQFDILYRGGQPVIVACGKRVSTWASVTSSPFFWPSVLVGGFFLLSGIGNILSQERARS